MAKISLDQQDGGNTAKMHPFHAARNWQDQMLIDKLLTQARIAKREGISRARVTQIMKLLRLPSEIQNQLQNPPAPLHIAEFSERRLRDILRHTNAEQVDLWRSWLGSLLKRSTIEPKSYDLQASVQL